MCSSVRDRILTEFDKSRVKKLLLDFSAKSNVKRVHQLEIIYVLKMMYSRIHPAAQKQITPLNPSPNKIVPGYINNTFCSC